MSENVRKIKKFHGKYRFLNFLLFFLSIVGASCFVAYLICGLNSSWTKSRWLQYQKIINIPIECLQISEDGKTIEGLSEYGMNFNYKGYNSIVIPKNIETIDSYAFSELKISNVSFFDYIDTFYSLDTHLKVISNSAFSCSNIESYFFSKTLELIDDRAFYSVSSSKMSFYFEENPTKINLGKEIISTMSEILYPTHLNGVYTMTRQQALDVSNDPKWVANFSNSTSGPINFDYYNDDWVIGDCPEIVRSYKG